jgi:hypothetical protein
MKHEPGNGKYVNAKSVWTFILWAVVLLAYIVQGHDSNWGLQNYHHYNTFTLFEGSFGTDMAPAGIQSYFNPNVFLPA